MKDYKGKSSGELDKLLAAKREELRVFRFGVVGGKVKNVKTGRGIRTAIAQILTEINLPKSR